MVNFALALAHEVPSAASGLSGSRNVPSQGDFTFSTNLVDIVRRLPTMAGEKQQRDVHCRMIPTPANRLP